MEIYLSSDMLESLEVEEQIYLWGGLSSAIVHIRSILEFVQAICRGEHPHLPQVSQNFDTIYIGWKRPHGDWVKLNCDGAYKESFHSEGDINILLFFSFHMETRFFATHCEKRLQIASGHGNGKLQD